MIDRAGAENNRTRMIMNLKVQKSTDRAVKMLDAKYEKISHQSSKTIACTLISNKEHSYT
jgi:hypothetical protein